MAALPALPRLAAAKKHFVMVPRATAVVGSETPAVQESEKYGIFKLDYDVKNVRRRLTYRRSQISHLSCTQEDPNLTKTWKKTLQIAVSGAAGQISNHLLFMVWLC